MRRLLLVGELAVVAELPRRFGGVFVVGHVVELLAALEHNDLQTLLGQLFGSPTARNPRTNDNGVVSVFFGRFKI